jgi:hypothetical protein
MGVKLRLVLLFTLAQERSSCMFTLMALLLSH